MSLVFRQGKDAGRRNDAAFVGHVPEIANGGKIRAANSEDHQITAPRLRSQAGCAQTSTEEIGSGFGQGDGLIVAHGPISSTGTSARRACLHISAVPVPPGNAITTFGRPWESI